MGVQQFLTGESGGGKNNLFDEKRKLLSAVQHRAEEFVSNNNFRPQLLNDFEEREKTFLYNNEQLWGTTTVADMKYEKNTFYSYWTSDVVRKFELSGLNATAISESILRHNGGGSLYSMEFQKQMDGLKKMGKFNAITLICELADSTLQGFSYRKKNGASLPEIKNNRSNLMTSCTLDTFLDFLLPSASKGIAGRIATAFCHKPYKDVLRTQNISQLKCIVPTTDTQISRYFQLWRYSFYS